MRKETDGRRFKRYWGKEVLKSESITDFKKFSVKGMREMEK